MCSAVRWVGPQILTQQLTERKTWPLHLTCKLVFSFVRGAEGRERERETSLMGLLKGWNEITRVVFSTMPGTE